ncbi:MAG: hypothetical protein ABEJ61_05230 [Haloferacaceae archaeon]
MTHSDSEPDLGRLRAALDAIPPVERSLDEGVLRVTRRFRGLTPEQAVRYLEHLGGERRGADAVAGDGWRARLSTRRVPVGPSYRLTEVTVTWTGDPAAVDPVVLRFRRKAFRAPG